MDKLTRYVLVDARWTYREDDVNLLINELSNIIFSLEQAVIHDPKWGRILRKDIKKVQQLRKKGIINSKYITDGN